MQVIEDSEIFCQRGVGVIPTSEVVLFALDLLALLSVLMGKEREVAVRFHWFGSTACHDEVRSKHKREHRCRIGCLNHTHDPWSHLKKL